MLVLLKQRVSFVCINSWVQKSLAQSYERRKRVVWKGKVAQYFLDKCSDGTYIYSTHTCIDLWSWTVSLRNWMNVQKNQHACFERREGSIHDFPIQEGIKTCMRNDTYHQRLEDNKHESDNENSLDGEESEESGLSCQLWTLAADYTFLATCCTFSCAYSLLMRANKLETALGSQYSLSGPTRYGFFML